MPSETTLTPPLRLLVITGLSPQVVTETIWALAQRTPPALPSEIMLLTTRAGAAKATRLLPSALTALSQQLGVALPAPEIRVMRDRTGRPLDDIARAEDNRAAADSITAAIRAATADPAIPLHVSIAGGRKTMGCLAAIALSLFGRERDELSHVLVEERFQGRDDFFFPPEPPRRLPLEDGGVLDTAEAHVVLAEVPFVRLRGQWRPESVGSGYAEAIAAAQTALAPPRLELDTTTMTARFGMTSCRLKPSLFGILVWFAERARRGEGAVICPHKLAGAKALAAECLAAVTRLCGSADHEACRAVRRGVADGLRREVLAEKVSRLNRLIRDLLGPEGEPYRIRAEGRRPFTGYRLALPAEAIRIIPEAP